jgi:outer membrane protein TolC
MRPKYLVILLLLILAPVGRAEIDYTNSLSLSLDDCIAMALEKNLDIRIRRLQPDIDTFSLESSLGAYDPSLALSASQRFNASPGSSDPNSTRFGTGSDTYSERFSPTIDGRLPIGTSYSLGGALFRQSGTFFPTHQYSSDLTLSVTQPLLKNFLIDANRRTIQVNKRTLKISELVFRHQMMRSISAVEQAYYELLFQRDNVTVQKASLRLAEQLLAENRRKVELGAMAPLEEKQAQSQVAARKADLLSATVNLDAQMNRLKALLSDEFGDWARAQIEPLDRLLAVVHPFAIQTSWKEGLDSRPDLLQSKEILERQNIVLRYNKNQLLPSLDLQLTYGHSGFGTDTFGGLDGIRTGSGQTYSYGLVLRIPFSNKVAKNSYRASRKTKERMVLEHKQLEQQIIVEIDNAVKSARTSYQRIEATREARLYAEAALEAEQKKYLNGKSTSFFVLQLQRDLTAARSTEIRSLADYNKSLSTLWLSEGSTLRRRSLEVVVE